MLAGYDVSLDYTDNTMIQCNQYFCVRRPWLWHWRRSIYVRCVLHEAFDIGP